MRDAEARATDRMVRRLSDIQISLCEIHDKINLVHKAQKQHVFAWFAVIFATVVVWLGLVFYLVLHR